MPEITLEFIGAQLERLFAEMRDMRAAIERIETRVTEIDDDLTSLARVMLRLDSRIHAVEQRIGQSK